MLKFFRTYNKIILVTGCVVLMIAFLIEPVISVFMPDPTKRVVGRVAGQTLTVRDLQTAEAQLQLFNRLSPSGRFGPLGMMVGSMLEDGSDRNLHWLLIRADARAMGLGASTTEVNRALAMLGVDDERLAEIAGQFGTSTDFVRASVADWLIAEQYRDLMWGRAFEPRIVADTGSALTPVTSPGIQRLRAYQDIFQYMSMAQSSQDFQGQIMMMYARQLEERTLLGVQRLSQPVLRAAYQDQRGRLSGRLVLVPARHFLDGVEEPTDEQVLAHFESYKNDLPGQSEPFGFGYRIPDRVQIETLSVSFEQVLATIRITEAEALAAYEADKVLYVAPPDPDAQPGTRPRQLEYTEVRDQVRTQLRRQRAHEKVEQIIRTAQGRIADAERSLLDDPEDRRYKLISEDATLPDLGRIADDLSEQFGVTVRHVRHDGWVESGDLDTLPGIGDTAVAAATQFTPFGDYVLSARQFLDEDDQNPIAAFRLQVGIVGMPMRGFDGSHHLFRLTDAQRTHAPANVEAVRRQVVDDLRLLAAYEALRDDVDVWLSKARTNGLEAVAEEVGRTVETFPAVPKREYGSGREAVVPSIEGIGRDRALIDSAFGLAASLSNRGPIGELDPSERIVASPIDGRFVLAIVEVGQYEPVTRSQFERSVTNPETRFNVSYSLLPQTLQNPLLLDNVKRRVGFVEEVEGE